MNSVLEFLKKQPKTVLAGSAIIAAVLLFIVWDLAFGFSPTAVKVIDARITFQFTAYHDHDEYFVSYALENTKKARLKAKVRVQLAEGGRFFGAAKGLNDNAVLEPLETKSFVTKFEIPKAKNGKERQMETHVKVRRVSRA